MGYCVPKNRDEPPKNIMPVLQHKAMAISSTEALESHTKLHHGIAVMEIVAGQL